MCLEIYDQTYYDRFLERANTDLGKQIYAERWDFIGRHCKGAMSLLDYGCASGAFHLSSTNGFIASGYDVNPSSPFNKDPNPGAKWDIMTFWDSLEHIPDFKSIIAHVDPTWIFLSTPNLESVQGPVTEWKHYRPREHIYYFDRHSIGVIFDAMGYEVVEMNFGEGALRDPKCPEAIISVALKKR